MSAPDLTELRKAYVNVGRTQALDEMIKEAGRLANIPGQPTPYLMACNDLAKFALAQMEKEQ